MPSDYLDGLRAGVLRYQQCTGCGGVQSLTRLACRHCGATTLAWRQAGGRGVVYAITQVWRAPSEHFQPLVPYTLLLVDLDEGLRVMAHGTDGLAIGATVKLRCLPHGAGMLACFHPGD